MRALGLERVVVQRAHLVQRAELGKPEIEDRLHVAGTEVLRHLGFGVVAGLRAPGRALLRKLGLGLQHIAAPRAPMGMNVDDHVRMP